MIGLGKDVQWCVALGYISYIGGCSRQKQSLNNAFVASYASQMEGCFAKVVYRVHVGVHFSDQYLYDFNLASHASKVQRSVSMQVSRTLAVSNFVSTTSDL